MKTNLKVILTAVGIAVLASPAMAQSGYLTVSPENWQAASGQGQYVASKPASIAGTYGYAARIRTHAVNESRQGGQEQGTQFRINDSVHVPFPQGTD
jgi:hypothetical protein